MRFPIDLLGAGYSVYGIISLHALAARADDLAWRQMVLDLPGSKAPLDVLHANDKHLQVPVKPCWRYYCVRGTQVGDPLPGEEPQIFDSVLDSGSGDFWVPASSNASHTFRISDTVGGESNILNNSFEISYNSKVGHHGFWMAQPLVFGGATVDQVQMGAAVDAKVGGMMGVGAATGGYHPKPGLPGILNGLVDSGIVNTQAYSLYLDPLSTPYVDDAGNGRVVFGGVDPGLYIGPLIQVPFFNTTVWYHLQQAGVNVSGPGRDSQPIYSSNESALLDSGSTALVIPRELGDAIAHEVDATRIPGTDGTLSFGYSCDWSTINRTAASGLTFDFAFTGNIVIKVSPSQLAADPYNNGTCNLLIATKQTSRIFGAAFLRAAFVVLDPVERRIAMAQARPLDEDYTPNITDIPAGSAPIPGAVVWDGRHTL